MVYTYLVITLQLIFRMFTAEYISPVWF